MFYPVLTLCKETRAAPDLDSGSSPRFGQARRGQAMNQLTQRIVLFGASIGSMLAGANAVHVFFKPNLALPKLGEGK